MTRAKTPTASADAGAATATKPGKQDFVREMTESLAVALVLAFLFKTFIAEAFVIPTGSMAPTLFGRHKDVACPQCGYHYEVGASVEMNDEGNMLLRRITQATCPNCRHEAAVKDLAVFKGDRILVNKFPYELKHPDRWDVCVFKFPEDPERNYIKRLIGLPGETIRLSRGDVFARPEGSAEFQILRKEDPGKQHAIQIIVADDQHPPRALLAQGWPERWAGMQRDQAPGAIDGWSPAAEGVQTDLAKRTHRVVANDWTWLRYRHFVPSPLDWESVLDNQPPAPNPRPQLITDYYAYNSFDGLGSDRDLFWVGDLTVSGVAEFSQLTADQPAWVLELVEGIRRYRCEINLSSGEATLSHTDDLNPEGPPVTLGTASTPVRGAGRYRFDFANVDDRLCLWINGRLIALPDGGGYLAPALRDPREGDLTPVGLATRGATAEFGELVIRRDIYYRAEGVANDDGGPFPSRLDEGEGISEIAAHQLREALGNPAEYARLYNEKAEPMEFAPLRTDEYFVMGDNSPQSQDSRLWTNRRQALNRHAVPRNAFVGKAFMVYWPHGVPFLNNGQGYPVIWHRRRDRNVENYAAYTFPFYPQFGRLFQRIR